MGHRCPERLMGKFCPGVISHSLPRRCLLCEQSAAECARGKTHRAFRLTHLSMEALLHDADSRNINQ